MGPEHAKEAARRYCERFGIGEVPVCGMEEMPLVLLGVDGNRYSEIGGNLWMTSHHPDVAYVGTSRHGGHMVLRPLFVKIGDSWCNSVTGKAAPPAGVLASLQAECVRFERETK